MEKERKETIATLYALRGGLSVMAQIQKSAEQVNEQIEQKQKELSELDFCDVAEEQQWRKKFNALDLHSGEDSVYEEAKKLMGSGGKRMILGSQILEQDACEMEINIAEMEVSSANANSLSASVKCLDKKLQFKKGIRKAVFGNIGVVLSRIAGIGIVGLLFCLLYRFGVEELEIPLDAMLKIPLYDWVYSVVHFFFPMPAQEVLDWAEETIPAVSKELLVLPQIMVMNILAGIFKRFGGIDWGHKQIIRLPLKERREWKEKERELETAHQIESEKVSRLEDLKGNRTERLMQIEEKTNVALAENQNAINLLQVEIAEQKDILDALLQQFHTVHESVRKEYAHFLDERDWGNIDLLIFNYETGRALDMRDALLQVDNERRNEKLAKAIDTAHHAIADNIARSTMEMKTEITKKMKALDTRIARTSDRFVQIAERISSRVTQQYQVMEDRLQRMTEQTQEQLEALAEVKNSQKAMIEEANKSSDELMESVKKVQALEEARHDAERAAFGKVGIWV